MIAVGAPLATAAVAGLVIANIAVSRGEFKAYKQASAAQAAQGTLKQRFAILSKQHTNKCSLASVDLDKIAVRGRLQGSCCSKMAFDHYAEQVHGLRALAAVREIPADPYDVPVALAKRLIGYGGTALTPAQQTVYDGAVKMSDEHGPCCCHCWRWKAFEGQANYLIARRRYSAAQVARVWDLEDGCGGV
jgi:hypothetical protein